MRTPKIYKNLLNKKQLTTEIIAEVLFSINKRAKKYRDQQRNYRHSRYSHADTAEKRYAKLKDESYQMKEKILAHFDPVALHEATYTKEYLRRIYRDSPEYKHIDINKVLYQDFSHTGVPFKQILITEHRKQYFLYYQIGEFSFHQPLKEEQLVNFDQLPRKKLPENFKVEGKERTELLSPQFCKQVYQLIVSQDFELV